MTFPRQMFGVRMDNTLIVETVWSLIVVVVVVVIVIVIVIVVGAVVVGCVFVIVNVSSSSIAHSTIGQTIRKMNFVFVIVSGCFLLLNLYHSFGLPSCFKNNNNSSNRFLFVSSTPLFPSSRSTSSLLS